MTTTNELFFHQTDRITLETLAAIGLHFAEKARHDPATACEILDAVSPRLSGKIYHQRLLSQYGTAHLAA